MYQIIQWGWSFEKSYLFADNHVDLFQLRDAGRITIEVTVLALLYWPISMYPNCNAKKREFAKIQTLWPRKCSLSTTLASNAKNFVMLFWSACSGFSENGWMQINKS